MKGFGGGVGRHPGWSPTLTTSHAHTVMTVRRGKSVNGPRGVSRGTNCKPVPLLDRLFSHPSLPLSSSTLASDRPRWTWVGVSVLVSLPFLVDVSVPERPRCSVRERDWVGPA